METEPPLRAADGRFLKGHRCLPGAGRRRGSLDGASVRRMMRRYVDVYLSRRVYNTLSKVFRKLEQRALAGDIVAAQQLLDLLRRR